MCTIFTFLEINLTAYLYLFLSFLRVWEKVISIINIPFEMERIEVHLMCTCVPRFNIALKGQTHGRSFIHSLNWYSSRMKIYSRYQSFFIICVIICLFAIPGNRCFSKIELLNFYENWVELICCLILFKGFFSRYLECEITILSDFETVETFLWIWDFVKKLLFKISKFLPVIHVMRFTCNASLFAILLHSCQLDNIDGNILVLLSFIV